MYVSTLCMYVRVRIMLCVYVCMYACMYVYMYPYTTKAYTRDNVCRIKRLQCTHTRVSKWLTCETICVI
jgi:hypothetical protein